MQKTKSARVIATPSVFAKKTLLFVQETGSLESLEPHISRRKNLNSLLFFVVTKGKGILSYQDKKYEIKAGDCIFLNCKNEYSHESSFEDPWTLSWVHFFGNNAEDLYNFYMEQDNSFLFTPLSPNEYLAIIEHLYHTQKNPDTNTELICHKELTDLFTLCFLEHNKIKNGQNQSIREKILQIRTYLDPNFAQKINLDQLSTDYFISKYHLSREFRKYTGVTFSNYLLQKRISHAKNLLRFSTDSIESISICCGIPDCGYFIKVFKNAENMTPQQYRKKW